MPLSTKPSHRKQVTQQLKMNLFTWLSAKLAKRQRPLTDKQRALSLIAAVDAGGLPLNPARVNDIARKLGLEVSAKAPVEQTIDRIRAACKRM
jgi:hypothetical protein